MKPIFDYEIFPNALQESYFEFHGEDFLFFDDPVEFYTLFRNNRKINSFQELMYIGEVLLWLNPDMEYQKFLAMLLWVSDRSNGKSIRTYSEGRVTSGVDSIWNTRKKPYVNKYRRIIFHQTRNIPREEKMRVIGIVCGRGKVNPQMIYDVVEELMMESEPITINQIAKVLSVTRQTVSRHITEDIKDIILDFNHSLLIK
jgi:DNA-binding transcriptional ArsR family regulator